MHWRAIASWSLAVVLTAACTSARAQSEAASRQPLPNYESFSSADSEFDPLPLIISGLTLTAFFGMPVPDEPQPLGGCSSSRMPDLIRERAAVRVRLERDCPSLALGDRRPTSLYGRVHSLSGGSLTLESRDGLSHVDCRCLRDIRKLAPLAARARAKRRRAAVVYTGFALTFAAIETTWWEETEPNPFRWGLVGVLGVLAIWHYSVPTDEERAWEGVPR